MYLRARSLLLLFLGSLGIGSLGGCVEWECQRSPALPDCHRLDLTEIKVRNQSTLSGKIWGPLLPQVLHERGPGAEFRIAQEKGQCQLKEWAVDADGSFSIRVNPEDLRSCQQSSQAELVAAAGSLEVRHPITLALTKFDKVTPVVLQPPQEDTAADPSIVWAGAKAPQGTVFILWKPTSKDGKPPPSMPHYVHRYRLVGPTLQRIDPLGSVYLAPEQVAKVGMTSEYIVSYEGASAGTAWYNMTLGKKDVSGEPVLRPTEIEVIQGSYLSQMAADADGDLLLIASRSLPPSSGSPEASLIARRVDGRKVGVRSDPLYDVSMLHTMIAGRLEGDKDTVCLLIRESEQYIDVLRMDESGEVLTQDPELAYILKKSIQEKSRLRPLGSSPIADVGAIGDLDGDGKNEIVLLRSDPISGPTQESQFVQRLLIIWNPLTEKRSVEVQDLPNFVLSPGESMSVLSIADLNGDKRPDLVVVSGERRQTDLLAGRIWFIPNPGFGM